MYRLNTTVMKQIHIAIIDTEIQELAMPVGYETITFVQLVCTELNIIRVFRTISILY